MSIQNLFLTNGTNKDKIKGDKLGIDVAGTLTKSYTQNGSLLLTGSSLPFNPVQLYDAIEVENNITKSLTIDNKTLLSVPFVTNIVLNDLITTNNLITKELTVGGKLLLNSDQLMTYIDDNDDLKINLTEKGQSNGVATLDGSGKVPLSQIPGNLLIYQGVFYETMVPRLQDGIGRTGDTWISNFKGLYNFNAAYPLAPRQIEVNINDFVIYNGLIWQVNRGTDDGVVSFNSRTGVVVPLSGDYSTFFYLKADTYTQTETNTQIDNKITLNNLNYYDKTATDDRIDAKITANNVFYYTKINIDTMLLNYALLSGATFTGDVTVNTNFTAKKIITLGQDQNASLTIPATSNTSGLIINIKENATTNTGILMNASLFSVNDATNNYFLRSSVFPLIKQDVYTMILNESDLTLSTGLSYVTDIMINQNIKMSYSDSAIHTPDQIGGDILKAVALNITYAGTATSNITNSYSIYCYQPLYGANKYTAFFQAGVGVNVQNATTSGYSLMTDTFKSSTSIETNTLLINSTSTFSGLITASGGISLLTALGTCTATVANLNASIYNLITKQYADFYYPTKQYVADNYVTQSYLSTYYTLTSDLVLNYLTKAAAATLYASLTNNNTFTGTQTYNNINTFATGSATTFASGSTVNFTGSTVNSTVPFLWTNTTPSNASININYTGSTAGTVMLTNMRNTGGVASVLVRDCANSSNDTFKHRQVLQKVSATKNLYYVQMSGAGSLTGFYGLSKDDTLGNNFEIYVNASLVTGQITTAPTNNNDITNKIYVDTIAATKLSLSGGTMTGLLVLSADPTANLNPVTLQYLQNNYNTVTTNNTLYARLTAANVFTNTNYFNGNLVCATGTTTTFNGTVNAATSINWITETDKPININFTGTTGSAITMTNFTNFSGISNTIYHDTGHANSNAYKYRLELTKDDAIKTTYLSHYISADNGINGGLEEIYKITCSNLGGVRVNFMNISANLILTQGQVLATPSNDNDMTNKIYVDTLAATKLNLSGGTMTGLIVLSGNPVANLNPVTLQYLQTNYNTVTTNDTLYARLASANTFASTNIFSSTATFNAATTFNNTIAISSNVLSTSKIYINYNGTSAGTLLMTNFANTGGVSTVMVNDRSHSGNDTYKYRETLQKVSATKNILYTQLSAGTTLIDFYTLSRDTVAGNAYNIFVPTNVQNTLTTYGLFTNNYNMETMMHPTLLVLPYYAEALNFAFTPTGLIKQSNYLELQYDITGHPATIPAAGVTNLVYSTISRSIRSFCCVQHLPVTTGNYYYYCFQFKTAANISNITDYMCGISTRPDYLASPDNLKYGLCENAATVTQIFYALKVSLLSGVYKMQETTTTTLANDTATTLNLTSLYNVYVFWNWDGNFTMTVGCAYQNASTGAVIYTQNKALPGLYLDLDRCPDIAPTFEIMGNAQLNTTTFTKFSIIKNISRTYINNVFGQYANANRINIFD